MAKVLIAGGAGFIGTHLARRCLKLGDDVTLLAYNSSSLSVDFDPKHMRIMKCDLRDLASTQNALANQTYEVVFNLAGYIDHTPFFKGGRSVLDQHFLAVQNLILTLDRSALKCFVQAGSSDEYGSAPSPQREDMREAPIAPYSLGKTAATHLIEMLSATESFPGVVVRFFLVYGPGQDQRRFLPQIIQACLRGEPFKTSEGLQERDFTFVEDVIDGLLTVAASPVACGQVLNLASGRAVRIREMVEQVVTLCGGGKPQFGAFPYRTGENMSLVADMSKTEKRLHWRPKISLEDGLRLTIAHYQKELSFTQKNASMFKN